MSKRIGSVADAIELYCTVAHCYKLNFWLVLFTFYVNHFTEGLRNGSQLFELEAIDAMEMEIGRHERENICVQRHFWNEFEQ